MNHVSMLRVLLTGLVLALALSAAGPVRAGGGGSNAGAAWNMTVVGQNDLGGRGFNADVWVHNGYAYVGQWGFGDWAAGSKDRFCPQDSNTSVLIIDSRNPATPQVVGRLQNPPNTSAEDIVVYTARYGPLKGHDIAAAGIQWCGDSRDDPNAEHGLMLWDVTNAAAPSQIGYLKTACCTRGVHEFEIQHRTDLRRTFAYASVPTSRYAESTTPSGYRDANGDGDSAGSTSQTQTTRCKSPIGASRTSAGRSMPARAATPTPTTATAPSHPMTASWSLCPTGTAGSSRWM